MNICSTKRRFRFSTAGIARWSARHHWIVISAWLVVLVLAAIAVVTGLGGALSGDDMAFLDRPESVQGRQLLEDRMTGPSPATETVIIRSETLTVEDPGFQKVVEATAGDLAELDGLVGEVRTYYQVRALDAAQAEAMVSADRHSTLLSVVFAADGAQLDQGVEEYLAAVSRHSTDGFQVLTIGDSTASHEYTSTAESDMTKAETIGLPITMVVLILVFGALVAAGVSLALALAAILASLGLATVVGHFYSLSFFLVNMIMMIGLAVGIDYALFIIERYREERLQGAARLDAITIAGGTASRAVLFSGGTVILALAGLFLVPVTTFRSLGTGAVLVVSVAVAAMLTLVPALLGLLGDRVDWPRWLRRRAVLADGQLVHDSDSVYRGFWGRVTRLVMARPIVAVLLSVVLLLALAAPAAQMRTGAGGGVDSLPQGDRRTAYELLARDFAVGTLSPVEVVVDAPRTARVAAGIERLVAVLGEDPLYAGQPVVTWNQVGDLALVSATLKLETNSPAAYEEIDRLREETVPQAFKGVAGRILVTGDTASRADMVSVTDKYTPWVFVFVLGLSFLVLLFMFRSVVVPLKAILMNLLSVAATYGLMVLVFEHGVGRQLFGFQQTATIQSWAPLFLFCILFGLSMDYHVFLLSRIREYYDETGRNTESVAVGLKATSRLITGAALIMVVVFSTFAAGDLVMMQQMGFGLAVAVLLDATVIRLVLVPASMALLGRWNWYLPKFLHGMPHLRIEGRTHVLRPVSRRPVRPPA